MFKSLLFGKTMQSITKTLMTLIFAVQAAEAQQPFSVVPA
jgi:hypothetical protein